MKPFEKITEQEREMIESYIGSYSDSDYDTNSCCRASLDHILRFWNGNKENLFHKLNDELIVEKEFTYNQSADEILATMSSENYNTLWEFTRKCSNAIFLSYGWDRNEKEDKYHVINKKTSEIVTKDFRTRGIVSSIFQSTGFVNNVIDLNRCCGDTYNSDYRYFIDLANGESVELINGMKLNKILKKISESYDIDGYEEYRLTQSLVTNQRKIKGTLCLSIHPLDYMTMSDNNSGWSSCMSWTEYGEFRQGTVEMMNSASVVVAYLKSDKSKYNISTYEWNSKKWRLLLIVTDDRIASIKSYPYFNEELTTAAVKFAKEVFAKDEDWDDVLYMTSRNSSNITPYNSLSKEYPILHNITYSTNIMYNDFYTTEHFCYKRDKDSDYLCHYNYSGPSECMWCGCELTTECSDGTETCLRCHDEDFCYCEWCGDRVYEDDAYWADGYAYCEYCFNEQFTRTLLEEDVVCIEDAEEVSVLDEDGKEIASGWKNCHSDSYSKYYGTGTIYYDKEKDIFYIPISELNNRGLDALKYSTLIMHSSDFYNIINKRLVS